MDSLNVYTSFLRKKGLQYDFNIEVIKYLIHALLEKPLLKNGTTLLCPTSTNLSVNIVITKSEHCANKELRDLNL